RDEVVTQGPGNGLFQGAFVRLPAFCQRIYRHGRLWKRHQKVSTGIPGKRSMGAPAAAFLWRFETRLPAIGFFLAFAVSRTYLLERADGRASPQAAEAGAAWCGGRPISGGVPIDAPAPAKRFVGVQFGRAVAIERDLLHAHAGNFFRDTPSQRRRDLSLLLGRPRGDAEAEARWFGGSSHARPKHRRRNAPAASSVRRHLARIAIGSRRDICADGHDHGSRL